MNTQYTNNWAKISFIALIVSSLILPTGVLANVPIKYFMYICCMATLFACWLNGVKISATLISLFIAVLLFVAFFSLVGFLHAAVPFQYIFSEGMLFISTTTVTLLILMGNSCKVIEDEEIVLSAFYGIFFFTLWKAIALSLVYLHIISFEMLMYYLEKYAQCNVVTDDIPGGFHRLSLTTHDFVATFFLFLIPAYPKIFSKIPVFLRIVFMITGTIALVSSYSRFFFAIIAMLWLYVFLFKLSFKQRIFTAIIIIAILLPLFPWISETFTQKFSSEGAEYSDTIRLKQFTALLDAWEDVPIFGGGLGYNTKDYIRLTYLYEVQWVSFLLKFGLVGISFLVFLLFLLFYKILDGKKTLDHYVLAFVLLCYILGAFTNPILLSSITAIFYVLPLILASILRKEPVLTPQIEEAKPAPARRRFSHQPTRP